jgi:hypothetical protein
MTAGSGQLLQYFIFQYGKPGLEHPMTATLLDLLMILSLGILAGTGTGLVIGFIAGKQPHDWAAMKEKDKITTILLVIACSATFMAMLAWYLFWFAGT